MFNIQERNSPLQTFSRLVIKRCLILGNVSQLFHSGLIEVFCSDRDVVRHASIVQALVMCKEDENMKIIQLKKLKEVIT